MTEYERGFIDGIKSKVQAELTPTLINVSKTMLEMLKPVLSTALENVLNDNNAITDTDVQPVKHGRWVQYNRNGEETYIECTNCCVPSRPRHLQMVTRSGEGLPDYCPNCGARMDLEDGDTDA